MRFLLVLMWLLVSALGIGQRVAWATPTAVERGFDALEQGDFATAARHLQTAAQQGDPLAQYWLGRLYRSGRGVPQNAAAAHRWFAQAAAQGLAIAQPARDALAPRLAIDPDAVPPPPAFLPTPAPEPLSEGLVARVQLALRRLGHEIDVNGQLTEQTRQLIRRYQVGAGAIDDGLPSEALLRQLNAARPQIEPAAPRGQLPPNPQDWRRVLLTDDFSDGNYEENPQWLVRLGRFWVEQGSGLRSDARVDPRVAEIFAPQPFPNRFAIEIQLTARQAQGRLEFAAIHREHQGYTLYYTPGATGRLALGVVEGRHHHELARTQRQLDITRGPQQLLWTRDDQGQLVVQVNGTEMLRVQDRRFMGDFEGLLLTNRGGDFSLREVRIKGAF